MIVISWYNVLQLPTITYHSLWLITLGKSNLYGFLYLSINVFTRNLLPFFAIYSRLSETCTRSWYDQFVKRGKKCSDGVIAHHFVSGWARWTRWAGWATIQCKQTICHKECWWNEFNQTSQFIRDSHCIRHLRVWVFLFLAHPDPKCKRSPPMMSESARDNLP